jgi:hypothetical protein
MPHTIDPRELSGMLAVNPEERPAEELDDADFEDVDQLSDDTETLPPNDIPTFSSQTSKPLQKLFKCTECGKHLKTQSSLT